MERQIVKPFRYVSEEEAKTLLMIVERQKEAFKNYNAAKENELTAIERGDLVIKKEWPKRDYVTHNNINPFIGFCKKMFNILKENVSVNVNLDAGETSKISITKEPGVMPDVKTNISKGPINISFDTKNMMKNIDHKGGGIRTY